MSVTGNSGSDAWEDLRHQAIRYFHTKNDPADPYNEDGQFAYSPVSQDFLNHDEVAELVGMEINEFDARLVTGGDPITSRGHVRHATEIIRQGDAERIDLAPEQQPPGGSTTQSIKPAQGLLFESKTYQNFGLQDTSTGTGAGDHSGRYGTFKLNFRDFADRGPLFDSEDDILALVDFYQKGQSSAPCEWSFKATLHWDIYEVESQYRDIKASLD
ncbi:MAG: hypothetical protein ABEI52_12755 [Halobacteriaceae archaeon]